MIPKEITETPVGVLMAIARQNGGYYKISKESCRGISNFDDIDVMLDDVNGDIIVSINEKNSFSQISRSIH